MSRLARAMAYVAVATLTVTGCRFSGVENASLPGGVGTGDDAIAITVELPDVGVLTENSQVKVNDIAVGTVTDLRVKDWYAVAELSLEPDTKLPSQVDASVGVNSLLGSTYVELRPSKDAAAGTTLTSGTRVPLERGSSYASTEEVLSSASVVLNGGGLEQVSTITYELNRALGGEDRAFERLLPRLDSFVATIDDQQQDIKTTVRALDRTAKRYSESRDVITTALDELGPALSVLARERSQLTEALGSLDRLRDQAVPLIRDVKDDLIRDLELITPTLQALEAAGPSLVRGLGFAVTFPFSPDVVTKACSAGYCNLFLTVDLQTDALLNGFISEDGTVNIPGFGGLDIPSFRLPGAVQGKDAVTQLRAILGRLLGSVDTSPNRGAGTGRTTRTNPPKPTEQGRSDADEPADEPDPASPTSPGPDAPGRGGLLDLLGLGGGL